MVGSLLALEPIQAVAHLQPPAPVPVIRLLLTYLQQPHLLQVHQHVHNLALAVLREVISQAIMLDIYRYILQFGTAPQDL